MKTFNLFFTLLLLFISFANADVTGTKIQGPALIEGFNEITSAAGTTTLTKDSQTKQILTGTTTQTFVLPDATTLPLSRRFLIINKSTGTATIQTSGGGALTIVSAGLQKEFHLRAAGSAAGTWDILEGGGSGGAWGGITGTLSDQTDLQSALDLKAPLASPTFTGTIGTPLTASRSLLTDGSGNLSASSVTSTELGYLSGVSSAIQTQFGTKAPAASPTFSGTITTPLTASRALVTGASSELTAATTTATEIGYVNGVTSAIQTQLDGKVAKSTATTKGDLFVATASATIARLGVGANNTFLKANSGATEGVEWASVSGAALAVTSKTTTYTATTSDDVISVSTGSAWTLTLYAASGNSGKVLRVIKTSSDTNALTIDGNSSETINGFADIKLNFQFDEVTLVCDGTNWHIHAQIKTPTVQKFTSGSGTYTTPLGTKYIRVRAVGGGGGGGPSGSASFGAATAGGNTTFGTTLLVANGGAAGGQGAKSLGGTASLGTGPVGIATNGSGGQGAGFTSAADFYVPGGQGGTSPFGGGGSGGGVSQSGSAAEPNSGSGGGGGGVQTLATSNYGGGGGASGGYVDAFIYSPSSTYAYAVGAAGSGGSAGTNGNSGGGGGAGIIIVEEFYQ